MANKTKPVWIQKFIRYTRKHGRLTAIQAEKLSGFTRRTLQHYLSDAVEQGGLLRTPKHGIFVDRHGYHNWLLEQRKVKDLAADAAEDVRGAIKITPYNPKKNVICRECRNSPAMIRVLSFYGAMQ